jgi:hypothetical protein
LALSDVLILCPKTHRPVPTGLTTNMVVFKTLPPVAVPLLCPACGQVHEWKPADAWISDIETSAQRQRGSSTERLHGSV